MKVSFWPVFFLLVYLSSYFFTIPCTLWSFHCACFGWLEKEHQHPKNWWEAWWFLVLSSLPLTAQMLHWPAVVWFSPWHYCGTSPIRHFCVTFLVLDTLFEPEKLLNTGPDVERTHSSPSLGFIYVNTDYLQDMWWKKYLSNYGTSQTRPRVLVYTVDQISLWNHICAVLLSIVSQVFKQS